MLRLLVCAALITVAACATAGDEDNEFGQGLAVPCNGHVELCSRSVADTAFATTHNSFSWSKYFTTGFSNQNRDISQQLSDGIRGFMLDTYWHKPLFKSARAAMCHQNCTLGGYVDLVPELAKIRSFLASHPNEVILLFIEQHSLTPTQFATAMSSAGLLAEVYTHASPTTPWPTLGKLISDRHRVIVFYESDDSTAVARPSWYHNMMDEVVQNPYSYKTTSQLACNKDRGNANAQLYLVNHFLSDPAGWERLAKQANPWPVVLDHVSACAHPVRAARGGRHRLMRPTNAAPGASSRSNRAAMSRANAGQEQQNGGPMVRRLQLGARLRDLRVAAGVPREEAGYAIRGSESKISRMELGRVSFKERDVVDLLKLYGVEDEAEHARLLALAREANSPGWWHAYGDVLATWFQNYLDLEQAAELIRTYEVQFVPGLLQTDAYARAVIVLGQGRTDPEVDRRADLRMARKQLLTREEPPRLWAVIDEAALHRQIGGPETLREQIKALLEVCTLRNVRLQILPFKAGGHAATGGAFTILRFPEADLPDVVYIEHLTNAIYLDKREDVDRHAEVMARLFIDAEPPDRTPEILRRALNDI